MSEMEDLKLGDPSGVECPHCGKLIRDLWDYSGVCEDGAITEMPCGWCDEPITLSCSVSCTIIASRKVPRAE